MNSEKLKEEKNYIVFEVISTVFAAAFVIAMFIKFMFF